MRFCLPPIARQLADLLDVNEYRDLPTELVQTFRFHNIVARGYPFWRSGDTAAVFALFFDNLATQL